MVVICRKNGLHTHVRRLAQTYARMHMRTHKHTHTQPLKLFQGCIGVHVDSSSHNPVLSGSVKRKQLMSPWMKWILGDMSALPVSNGKIPDSTNGQFIKALVF